MTNSVDTTNELKELSPLLAAMEKVNVFTVPGGYFERVGEVILLAVNEETGTLLNSISNQIETNVPPGYFDSLAENILSKIKSKEENSLNALNENQTSLLSSPFPPPLEEIEEAKLYPMSYSIQNKNVFTVPYGYFDALPENILNLIKPKQVKVVNMGNRNNWFKYAAAAVFVGVIMFGAYRFIGTENKVELPQYVKEGMKINNVDEELAKITNEDIIKYLQADGTDVDDAMLANTIDENELPTQDDYFTNDKTLDNYLDNIDINDLKN
jgi:hypothetical protein